MARRGKKKSQSTPKLEACSSCGALVAPKNMQSHKQKVHSGSGSSRASNPPRARPKGKGQVAIRGNNSLRGHLGSIAGIDSTRFIWRYLHPCDEVLHGATRIPDMWSGTSAALELRTMKLISSPASAAEVGTWDLLYLSLPHSELAGYVLTRPSGGEWITQSDANRGTTWTGYVLDYRTLGGSSYETPMQAEAVSTSSKPTSINLNTSSVRGVFKGVTINLVATALTNQGMIYSGQWSQTPEKKLRVTHDWWTTDPKNLEAEAWEWSDLPGSPEALDNRSGGLVVHQAKQGAYIPHKYSEPTHRWREVGASSDWIRIGLSDATKDDFVYVGTSPVPDPDPTNPNGRLLNVTSPLDVNCACTIMMGLDVKASVQIKVRSGIECVVSPNSAWGGFSESSAPYDPRSLEVARKAEDDLQQAYPASYNDFGILSGILGGILKSLAATGISAGANWLVGKIRGMGGGAGSPVAARALGRMQDIPLD